jgi:hypothetical protein
MEALGKALLDWLDKGWYTTSTSQVSSHSTAKPRTAAEVSVNAENIYVSKRILSAMLAVAGNVAIQASWNHARKLGIMHQSRIAHTTNKARQYARLAYVFPCLE